MSHVSSVDPFDPASRVQRRRWWTLAVLCCSLLLTGLDNTILNTALPRLVSELGATNSQLQWIVDAYTLAFAGLLLAAGSLGDRFGRRGAWQIGLAIFGLGSLLSAFATSPGRLIATRALMGVGGALIMPSTLSILTNVFPAHERARAIGIWSGVAGVGVALGPIIGGFLLAHFWWGSTFIVNVPLVVIGLGASLFLVPTSRDPSRPRQDPIGALLSIVGLTCLVYAIIDAPDSGWGNSSVLAWFGAAIVALLAFALWEMRSAHPMLEIRFFRNPRFSASCISITLVLFALLGGTFIFTQYLQFVLGYTPLQAGVRMLPLAAMLTVVSLLSPRLAERFGTKIVVATGLLTVALALALYMGFDVDTSYGDLVWRILVMAAGVGLVMAPATESIMGSLPRVKAGVGSAVNDTTRQIGAALGVAVVGSAMSSVYRPRMSRVLAGTGIPADVAGHVTNSLGGALRVAAEIGGDSGLLLARAAREAFVAGMMRGLVVSIVSAVAGAVVAAVFLPARARDEDVDAEWAAAVEAEASGGRRRALTEV